MTTTTIAMRKRQINTVWSAGEKKKKNLGINKPDPLISKENPLI